MAVIVPAAVAGLLILTSSALTFRESQSMVCPKCFAFLAYLILFICLIFYIIFAALAIGINYQATAKRCLSTPSPPSSHSLPPKFNLPSP